MDMEKDPKEQITESIETEHRRSHRRDATEMPWSRSDVWRMILVGTIGALMGIILYSGILFATSTSSKQESTTGVNEVLVGENISIPDVVAKTSPGVVQISRSNGKTAVSLGSGVIIDAALGYVVTNYHVVEQSGDLTVNLLDGRVTSATRIGVDPDSDLAVIQLEDKSNLTALELGDSASLKVGQMAIAIGSPLSLDFANTVTVGVISALARDITVTSSFGNEVILSVLQTDAAINPGNSGGALINSLGQLIGINSIKISDEGVEGMGFAIPSNTLRPIIESLIKDGKVNYPYLGVGSLSSITDTSSNYYDLPKGVLIGTVAEGSPASKSGIRPGDVITAVNGTGISTSAELRTLIYKQKPGDTVSLKIYRGRSFIDYKVTLK